MGNSALIKSRKKVSPGRVTDNTFDRIYKFYFGKNGCKLTTKQEEIRDRWEKAYAMLCDFKTARQTARLLSKVCDIDQRTAYHDINNAMRLFGDPKIGLKAAKRAIVNEWIIKALEKTQAEGDWKAHEKLILRYTRINGLDADQDNPIADLLTKLKPTKIVFTTDPNVLQQDADRLMEDVEDVDYTPVD